MKRSEVLTKYYNNLINTMIEKYRSVIESYGRIQYAIYIWSNGEIETLEQVQGDNGYLKANDNIEDELFYVRTIASPGFDPWDYTDHSAPDDEAERDQEEREIIDYIMHEYSEDEAYMALESAIAQALIEEE